MNVYKYFHIIHIIRCLYYSYFIMQSLHLLHNHLIYHIFYLHNFTLHR